eukprot:12684393-Alexandrium_andersonii.AAC.1
MPDMLGRLGACSLNSRIRAPPSGPSGVVGLAMAIAFEAHASAIQRSALRGRSCELSGAGHASACRASNGS